MQMITENKGHRIFIISKTTISEPSKVIIIEVGVVVVVVVVVGKKKKKPLHNL